MQVLHRESIYASKQLLTGKSDSLYIYILFNCPKAKLIEHIHNQMNVLERMSDAFKRSLLTSRYRNLEEMYAKYSDAAVFNEVAFIDDDVESFSLSPKHIHLLHHFSHPSITFKFGASFDLAFLFDLVENSKTYDVFRMSSNNKIEHLQLSRTKKRSGASAESKDLNLLQFINSNKATPQGKYVLFGVSSKLKGFTDVNAYSVLNRTLKDSEIFEMFETIEKESVLDEFEKDLEMLKLDRLMHRVCFQSEIKEKILCGQLEKLYLSGKKYQKFVENLKRLDIDITFKVIVIDTDCSSFVENREKVILQYDGVVGILYY